jgi:dTDP-4-amino-4,6-dideoxygalactose transaminase
MSGPPVIPFNKPHMMGRELEYIRQAVEYGNISGDGHFTQACADLLEKMLGGGRVLMTPSCTAALEMALILCDLRPGDEVILPSFTFVSTANAVLLAGGQPIFCDIRRDTLNMDESLLPDLITSRTRAVLPVHYAGVGCDMDPILQIAAEHELFVIEDAAQAVDSQYKGKQLGGVGDLGAFSFHETKNFMCGEGGALAINREDLIERAEIIRDKGTDRKKFFRGEVEKYRWVDIGSSYVPSEIVCAFLYGQLECMPIIGRRRQALYDRYSNELAHLKEHGHLRLPHVPAECRANYHLFFVLAKDEATRDALLQFLHERNIRAVFHYVPLHSSPMGTKISQANGSNFSQLPVTDELSRCLLRLPMFYAMTDDEQGRVIEAVNSFFSR